MKWHARCTYQTLSVCANGSQHRCTDLLHDGLYFSDLVRQRHVLVDRLLGVSGNAGSSSVKAS